MAATTASGFTRKSTICLLLFLVTLLGQAEAQTIPLSTLTHDVLDEILARIDADLFQAGNSIRLAAAVRLAFHDCALGCDGSVNLFATHNRGLENVMRRIQRAYFRRNGNGDFYSTYLSFPDFVVLATQRAVGHGIQNSGEANVPFVSGPHFYYGRPAGPTWNSDPTESAMVDGRDNWSNVLSFIQNDLSPVTETEFIALLGLHSMGRCNSHNSGYQGPWGPGSDRDVINNHFFSNLLGIGQARKNFSQVASVNSTDPAPNFSFTSPDPDFNKIQWQDRGRPRLMLNTDMAIYHQFTADSQGNVVGQYCSQGNNVQLANCTEPGKLPVHPIRGQLAHDFAWNNLLYLQRVMEAFIKMTQVLPPGSNTVFNTITPQKTCQNGVEVCQGDVFRTNCGGLNNANCAA